MAECLQCGKKGLFLILDHRGICKNCAKENEQAELHRRIEFEQKRKDGIREAKKFIAAFGEMVQLATKHTVILPDFGKNVIAEQRKACSYVLDHIDDWRQYEFFAEAVKDTPLVYSGGTYKHPVFNSSVYGFMTADFEKQFANLKRQVDHIHTKCIIAEYNYYDYSELYHVVGVTFKNGRRNRQTILRQIKFHDAPYEHDPTFRLERYLYEGEDAVAVYADEEQVGNISKSDLPWLIEHLDEFYCVSEYEVIGGGGLSYGLYIRACFRKKEDSHV